MRLALLCAAALFAAPVMADEMVASNGADSVRLLDSVCSSDKVLEQIDPALRPQLKDAAVRVQGESFKACWVLEGDVAHLLYEDGDIGAVPISEFKKAV